jgi:peptidoglycan LD-endopeptidase LytH
VSRLERGGIGTPARACGIAAAMLLVGCGFERPPPPDEDLTEAVVETAPAPLVPIPRTPIRRTDSLLAPPVDTAAPSINPALGPELVALRAGMVVPVQGTLRSQLRDSYTEARGGRVHEAMDIMAPLDTPVLSASDGRILKLHLSVAGGKMVYAADASDEFILMYAHLDHYADGVTSGMPIRRGQLIGYVGVSGNADPANPHLHFAIARGHPSVSWWLGTPVNPYPLLAP